jgi:hypothetical protein
MAMTTEEITRRDLLWRGATAAAVGGAALVVPCIASADVSHGSEQIGEIYELQAAFHRAKTTQDLDLMMSLWADDATFTNTTTAITYVGADQIRTFWQGSGSFTHHRFSLVPSYKTTIQVQGDQAATGGFDDPAIKTIVNDSFLAGTLNNIAGTWLFANITAGSSSPLSYDTYYFPIPQS